MLVTIDPGQLPGRPPVMLLALHDGHFTLCPAILTRYMGDGAFLVVRTTSILILGRR